MRNMTRRGLASGSLGGIAALGLVSAATAAAPAASPGPNITPAVEAAWQAYLAKLQAVRRKLYASRFCNRPEVRLAANELIMTLQTVMYNWVMGIRTDYPRFDLHGRFNPNVHAYGLMNPDFAYRSASVDGAREYRLWGKKGTSRFFDIQVDVALDGKPNPAARSKPRNYRLDNFQMAPDGTFEIFASARPQPGNWIQLPNARNVGMDVREAFYDWDETPVEIHIEVSDGRPTSNFLLSEAEYITRLEAMGDLLDFVAVNWGIGITDVALRATNGAFNAFGWQHMPNTPGTNPKANYADCVYNLADDEALIMEFDEPKGLYWGVQLGDVLMRSTDFVYHQSSLNGHQARVSGDGKVRMVVSKRDPLVANWLDVVGTVPLGFVQFRQYFTDNVVDLPKTKVVKVADVRKNLPGDTAMVTPVERQETLTRRRRGKLRQYGY